MATKKAPITLPTVDALFGIPSGSENVIELPIWKLIDFTNHPFKVEHDEEFQKLVDSIEEYGILSPLIVRKQTENAYEIISGHRRKAAAEEAGLGSLPVLVRDMTDEEATILMVDANIQRENLLPSEKAFAYRMKLEAIKKQGERTDLTESKRLNAREVVAKEAGVNRMEVSRYIRLTYLVPVLLDRVDKKSCRCLQEWSCPI